MSPRLAAHALLAVAALGLAGGALHSATRPAAHPSAMKVVCFEDGEVNVGKVHYDIPRICIPTP